MRNTVPIEELRKVSYLDVDSLGDRIVNLMPLWDGQSWYLWMRGPHGLFEIKPLDTSEVAYVAKIPAEKSDLSIPFVEFMWQRASFPEVCPLIRAICDDFHNMGTSVAKLRHFFQARENLGGVQIARFATTELEYLVILSRTIFDLLQEAVAHIWERRVKLSEPVFEKRRKSQKLPDKFSKMVLCNKQLPRTGEEMERRFNLPSQLASEYARCAPFFASLRTIRNDIVHGGSGTGIVFTTEKGFCVHREKKPFSSYMGWNSKHHYGNGLVSVLPWIANIIVQTTAACNAIMLGFGSAILFPPDIAPGYRVFVRGPSMPSLLDILHVYEGGSPWWDEESKKQLSNETLQPNLNNPAEISGVGDTLVKR